MSTRPKFQAVGECMVEIVRVATGKALVGYSGDTYNTAVYVHRVGAALDVEIDTRFLSGIGNDPESDLMAARWAAEGIAGDTVVVPGASPGLYLISTDDAGERSFSYWRENSAAAQVFSGTDWIERLEAPTVYLSGISLQLMSPPSRRELRDRLADLRARGTRVVFDSNYRPTGWRDVREARSAMAGLLRLTDVALVTLDDEIALGTCDDVESCADRLRRLGVNEIVVKVGAQGVWVLDGDDLVHVPSQPVVPVDTTAAGDSFNGGYLAARAAGASPVDAACLGNTLAGQVVRYPGAIIAREQMPELHRWDRVSR